MQFPSIRKSRRYLWMVLAALICLPTMAMAHERFVNHVPRWPINEEFFQTLHLTEKNFDAGTDGKPGKDLVATEGQVIRVDEDEVTAGSDGQVFTVNGQEVKAWKGQIFKTGGRDVTAHAGQHFKVITHQDQKFYYETFSSYDMLNISTRVAIIMTGMIFIWFLRVPIYGFIMFKLLGGLKGKPREILELLGNFAMDRPVEHPWFTGLSQWVVVFFMRCPALVLMFAAANNSLVMPSYPLEPSTLAFFQYAQVIMAIGILTQSFLPLGGATIFGTFLFLLCTYDWKIAVDILPVLTVAVIYISSPWDSWKRVISTVNMSQMRWVRIILGFGFFALGWMKLYNYYLTVGVADNYLNVLTDPMIQMFYIGTTKQLQRECWIIAFGMAEVLTGFLIMVGIFNRIWCFMMVYLFSKLMVLDFGWAEIPHLYPIGAFMVVLFSNSLSNEFGKVDDRGEAVVKAGGKGAATHVILSLILAFVLSFLAIYPMLWLLSQVEHPKFF